MSRTYIDQFLAFLEKLIANANNVSPNLCLRYIDDIFAVFDSGRALVHSFWIFSIPNTTTLNLPSKKI